MKRARRGLSASAIALLLTCAVAHSRAQQPPTARFPSAAKPSPEIARESGPTVARLDEDGRRERARTDYVLHCSGCHFMHGEGNPAGGIPRVRNQIGYFLTLPEGRAYLMQVPGLLSAGLQDEDAARLVNWMVDYFSGASRPPSFTPYTAEEARRYRLHKPADIIGTRKRLATELRAAGHSFQ
jgi:hypothetical protein